MTHGQRVQQGKGRTSTYLYGSQVQHIKEQSDNADVTCKLQKLKIRKYKKILKVAFLVIHYIECVTTLFTGIKKYIYMDNVRRMGCKISQDTGPSLLTSGTTVSFSDLEAYFTSSCTYSFCKK